MAGPANTTSGEIAKTMNGARAKVIINGATVGLATDCSWSVAYGQEPIFTLGKFSAQEIVPTSAEPVEVTLNGMRVVNSGPHAGWNPNDATGHTIMVPVLAELLNNRDMTIEIYDRQQTTEGSLPILSVVHCRSKGYSSQVSAKGIMTLSMNFIGIVAVDEHSTPGSVNDETASEYGIV